MPIYPKSKFSKIAEPPVTKNGPVNSNKGKIIIIAVIALAAAAAVWKILPASKSEKIIQGLINDAQENTQTAETLQNAAGQLLGGEAAETSAPLTPEEKFQAAITVPIANGEHGAKAEELNKIASETFGEYKITGYTKGYMGMNSGSGVIQYTFKKPLELVNADALRGNMEKNGFTVTALNKEEGSAGIVAEKDGYKYSLSYNEGEQEMTAIIEKMSN